MAIHGRLLGAVGFFFCLVLSDSALASGLRVSPLRLDFTAADRSGNIQVSNLGPTPIAVQISAYRWRQEDGRDVYEPTKDIFFAPPIVSIEGQKNTIVRFRLRSAIPKEQEEFYRVYFQEVPPASQETQGAGMAFRLRFGIPVFVQPEKAVAPRIAISGDLDDGRLQLVLENTGKAHIKIDGIGVFPPGTDREQPDREPLAAAVQAEQGTNYLHPGTRLDWKLQLPDGTATEGLMMLIRTDDYSARAAAGMTPQGWLWLPLKTDDADPNRP